MLAAGSGGGPASRDALADLCGAYWYPVYGFVRGQGYGEEDARDLTQAYFSTLLEKDVLNGVRPELGRFRSFLLASLRNFLSHERDRERALKRGGSVRPVPIDTDEAERWISFERAGERSPETSFELRWAKTVVRRSMIRLQREFDEAGQSERFELLRGFLMDDAPTRTHEEIARRLDVSVNGSKSMVLRLRKRFGVLLRAEVAQTVARQEETDEELRHLLRTLEDGAS